MPQQTWPALQDCVCPLCTATRAGEDYDGEDYDDYDDDNCRGDGAIMPHGWRPRHLIFRGQGPVFLGMELELEAPVRRDGFGDYRFDALEAYSVEVQDRFGDIVWLQEDGSIGYGFEITTHPMTYRWAMDHFPWEEIDRLHTDGCQVSRNVGIHVHVSRAAFDSECHMYRWMKFVYRNERQVSRLARRQYSEWASFDAHYRANVKHYVKGRSRGDGRYQAINPTNPDTLEVRVFASSLQPREVRAALAFVDSSVEYTRTLDAHAIIQSGGWTWSQYVEWLRERDLYRPILDELEALSCVS